MQICLNHARQLSQVLRGQTHSDGQFGTVRLHRTQSKGGKTKFEGAELTLMDSFDDIELSFGTCFTVA